MTRLLVLIALAGAVALPVAQSGAPLGSPRAAAARGGPLPDRETFLAEARKRLASNDLLQSRYSYRVRVTEVRMNPFGRIGTGPVEVYEVYPVVPGRLTYRRLIERDGVRVSPADLQLADRQFLARYAQWQREVAREGQDERAARLEREAAERQKDRARADETMRLFDFTLERRDTLDGAPMIVVRFAPKPDAQPRSREGRVASSFAGTAWVHEHEYEVMRVEAEAFSEAVFGYGLIARLHKGAKALFTRRKFGTAWLPLESRVTGTGRALLVRKIAFNYLREYSDYRLFDPADLQSRLAAAIGNN
jgi:hypothetical protein